MTIDAARASAQALPAMNRRTALALTGSGITAALVGVAGAVAQPTGVQALIEAHRAAVAFSDAQWDICSDVADANPDVDSMLPKVQYARLLLGRNDDSTDQFKPLFAYDEAKIDEVVDRDLRTNLSVWGSGKYGEQRRPDIYAKAEARRERLKAELRRQQTEEKTAEDACGITAARDAAKAASRAAEARMDALLAYQCRDAAEVTALATYLVECEEQDIVDEESLVTWVRALAGKVVRS
ncbi:MAG: hypothetical protein AB7P20_26145 [Rhizobiaceae bacterium]